MYTTQQQLFIKFVLVMTLTVVLFTPDQVTSTSRWLSPCISPASVGPGSTAGVGAVSGRYSSGLVLARTTRDVTIITRQRRAAPSVVDSYRISYLTLSNKLSSLKRRVRELKALYVSSKLD